MNRHDSVEVRKAVVNLQVNLTLDFNCSRVRGPLV